MSCSVHSEPRSEVKWYKDTMLLDQTSDRRMETFGNRHVLILRRVRETDFGNYSCFAENSLGRQRGYIDVSGRPHAAKIVSPSLGYYKDQYNLTWTVDSFLPIKEYRILYREFVQPVSSSLWCGSHSVTPALAFFSATANLFKIRAFFSLRRVCISNEKYGSLNMGIFFLRRTTSNNNIVGPKIPGTRPRPSGLTLSRPSTTGKFTNSRPTDRLTATPSLLPATLSFTAWSRRPSTKLSSRAGTERDGPIPTTYLDLEHGPEVIKLNTHM